MATDPKPPNGFDCWMSLALDYCNVSTRGRFAAQHALAELAELRKDAEKWRHYCRQYDNAGKDDDNGN